MLKLKVALAALTVLAACNRSTRDAEVPASQPPREQQDIAGATQPPALDTTVPAPARSSATRASGRPAERHPTPVHHRKTASTRSRAAQQPDTASRGRDSVVSRDSVSRSDSSPPPVSIASSDSGVGTDSSAARNSSSATDSTGSSDTVGYSSYPGTASPSAPVARVVAAGTVIPVSLEDSINSRHDTWGKQITGQVMQNIRDPNGEVLVQAGSPLKLTVSRLRAGRGNGKGEIEIQPDSITVQGHARKLHARVESVPYELKGRGVTGDEAAKVGVGAAGGAVVGGVVTGKTKGAVIGGVVGAAAGAAVASQTAAKDVVVAARTPVRVVLTAPLVIR